MIFLSQLTLNPRSRQVQKVVREPYQMHRVLSLAFAGKPEFEAARLMFRLEDTAELPCVLAQSLVAPDWTQLNGPDRVLHTPPQTKQFAPSFVAAQRLAFRLRANPTVKRDGNRIGLGRQEAARGGVSVEELQTTWLHGKGENGGFKVLTAQVGPYSFSRGKKKDDSVEHDLLHLAVQFDGVLEVTDPELFLKTVQRGIGSAKAFGFGLLSLARLK